ncbi:MAG TPA: hypothetical protein EYH56_01125 [Nanoarchaeota archaeon]|nr:hypothetical protein [Nanoarchaeota archaeon]
MTEDITERKTKIICTIGPSSQKLVQELAKHGMDIARINTAYTDNTDIGFENVMVDVRHWKRLEELYIPENSIIALSFVRKAECVKNAKNIVESPICAKIETAEAIRNLKEIVKHSEMIMIARGDLGKEFGIHAIPILQEKIIKVCKEYEKPFIVATEVLKSMVNHPVPTRAEAIDVWNAVKSGAFGILLADETAIGKYPVEAVKWLDKLIKFAENHEKFFEF